MRLYHGVEPVYNKFSKVLILGTFPSVKSREAGFFYSHPQNRFWRVIAKVTNNPVPKSIEEKRAMLLNCGIALWDVVSSCEITGSEDSSIKNVVPNDIKRIIAETSIKVVFLTGGKAFELYKKFFKDLPLPFYKLPSTSPANAKMSVDDLVKSYEIIKEFL